MNILEYFLTHPSIIRLQFSEPEIVSDYICSNFVIDDNINGKLYLLSDKGRIDYIIPCGTLVDATDTGFLMHNKFQPSPISVQVYFGGAILP
jgi:hypothetical protein